MTIAQMLATTDDHDHWFPFFPLIPLFFIGLWILVFATFRRRWRHHPRQSGESVLAERYALYPRLRLVFCSNRKTAAEWTRAYFAAVWSVRGRVESPGRTA